jgi:signal transduction histidine kinase
MTNYGLWRRLRNYGFRDLGRAIARFPSRAIELLRIPAPDAPQLIDRITTMERDIVLPLKAAGIAMLLHSFYFTPWFGRVLGELEIAVETTQYFLWIYIGLNVVVAGMLFAMHRLPLPLVSWVVFAMSLVDGIFLSALTVVTGGYESILYWIFLALIVRGAVSVPRATSQIMLNLTLVACYVMAGLILIHVADYLDATQRDILFPGTAESPAEPLLLRLVLLVLMTVCCYGVQVLLDRQRRAVEEAREFAMREGQLQSAGRVAAEFTHQIKNPLAIINNAAFSLQRAVKQGRPVAPEQIRIIQEEVERSDRIITEIMGYAQLSEGHVEKLNVIEELDNAIERVFPPAVQYPVQVHRQYGTDFPPLLMQRRHLSESFINVLQNAREALGEKGGSVFVNAQCHADLSVEVSIRDDGPGIPPEKHGKVFEAYYTTKEKGTGLGLASVKHNVELYGGAVRVESELGKGARFVLLFPAKALIKLAKRHEARSPRSES